MEHINFSDERFCTHFDTETKNISEKAHCDLIVTCFGVPNRINPSNRYYNLQVMIMPHYYTNNYLVDTKCPMTAVLYFRLWGKYQNNFSLALYSTWYKHGNKGIQL